MTENLEIKKTKKNKLIRIVNEKDENSKIPNILNLNFEELKKIYDDIFNIDKTTYKSSNDEPTPIDCVIEMIEKIPDTMYKKKDLKILDPCCGNCNF